MPIKPFVCALWAWAALCLCCRWQSVCLGAVHQSKQCSRAAAPLLHHLQMLPHGEKRLPRQLCIQSEQQLIVTPRSKGRAEAMWQMPHLRHQLNTHFQSFSSGYQRLAMAWLCPLAWVHSLINSEYGQALVSFLLPCLLLLWKGRKEREEKEEKATCNLLQLSQQQ